jgi:hypothetical protein
MRKKWWQGFDSWQALKTGLSTTKKMPRFEGRTGSLTWNTVTASERERIERQP